MEPDVGGEEFFGDDVGGYGVEFLYEADGLEGVDDVVLEGDFPSSVAALAHHFLLVELQRLRRT